MTDGISLSTIVTFIGATISTVGAFWLAFKETKTTYSKRILITIFIGSILSGIGAIWSSIQQSHYEKELRLKNEEILATITGGDSYAYIDSPIIFDNQVKFPLINKGRCPLYEVTVEVVDVAKMRQVFKKYPPPYSGFNFDKIQRLYVTTIKLGTMYPSPEPDKSLTGQLLGPWNLPRNQDYQSYSIWINALNGGVTQQIALKRTNTRWTTIGNKAYTWSRKENKHITLHEHISKDFPRNQKGELNWSLPPP